MDGEVLSRRDVHRAITETIAAAIEAGAKEYKMPWHQGVARPVNACTGKAYHGVNVVALWGAANRRGFRTAHWATYRQWASLGAQVRKGERGSVVVFYKTIAPATQSQAEEGEAGTESSRLVARASWAFNADQVEGWSPPAPDTKSEVQVREHVEAFIAATRANIRNGGTRAYYDWAGDFIAVPWAEHFVATETSSATEGYYSVVLHELTHWSGAAHRLARNLRGRFGDHAYALEELIAEFGAAFLCADLAIANEPRLDHASYVSSWLRALNDDRTALFAAASKASVAATYLSDFSRRLR
jgi:antirestriction protein ArdC